MALHDALGNIMLQLHSINDRLEELEKTRATSPTDASSSTPPQVHGLPKSSLQPSPIMQKHPSATPFSKGTFTTPSAVHPRIHGGALPAKANEAKEMPLKAKLRRFPGQGQWHSWKTSLLAYLRVQGWLPTAEHPVGPGTPEAPTPNFDAEINAKIFYVLNETCHNTAAHQTITRKDVPAHSGWYALRALYTRFDSFTDMEKKQ